MLSIYSYKLPFKAPFKTAAGTFTTRAGLLICYEEKKQYFWGEAAPLPGFSAETVDEINVQIHAQKSSVKSFLSASFDLNSLNRFIQSTFGAPSLQFALSCLGLDLLSHREKCTIGDLFGVESTPQVLVNDVIGHTEPAKWNTVISDSINSGFTCIKIKAIYPFDELAQKLRGIYRNHPNITYRLDANRSWPKDQSARINDWIRSLPVEYIEEPFSENEEYLLTGSENPFPFPIALDESIHNPLYLEAALKQPRQIVILKPAFLGNLCDWLGTIQTYRSSFSNIVVTTALETAIGRTAIAGLAGLIGCRNRSHGLNTGKLFRDDLFPVSEIRGGRIDLPLQDLKSISPKHLNTEYIFLSDF